MNPYIVLNVTAEADDATIRRAYLESVKIWSPEHHSERFQAVTAAYEKIKDAKSRAQYELFDLKPTAESPLDLLSQWVRFRGVTKPLSSEALKALLRACSKN